MVTIQQNSTTYSIRLPCFSGNNAVPSITPTLLVKNLPTDAGTTPTGTVTASDSSGIATLTPAVGDFPTVGYFTIEISGSGIDTIGREIMVVPSDPFAPLPTVNADGAVAADAIKHVSVPATPASGTVQVSSLPSNGDTFTVRDAAANVVVFNWQTTGPVTAPTIQIVSESSPFVGNAAAANAAIQAIIASTDLRMTSSVSSDTVSLTDLDGGTAGNVAISQTGSNCLTLSGMSGGVDASYTWLGITADSNGNANVNLVDVLGVQSPAAPGSVSIDWGHIVNQNASPNFIGTTIGTVSALTNPTRANVLHAGTAQSGSTSATIKLDAGASSVTGYYANSVARILNGTGAGQSAFISSYVGSTRVATISTTWAVTPDNTSVFDVIACGSPVISSYTGNTPQTGDIMARLGAPAGASVSADIAAVQTGVNNINNLSALASLIGPPAMEVPSSGSIAYPFTVLFKDSEGHQEDVTGTPTIAVHNAAGTDRSANLSSVSHPGIGQYTFTYTVAAGATQEGLTFKGSGTASSDSTARLAYLSSAVVAVDTVTAITGIQTYLTNNLGTNGVNLTAVISEIDNDVQAVIDYLDANVGLTGSNLTSMPAMVWNVLTSTLTVSGSVGKLVSAFQFDGSNFIKATAQVLPSPAPSGYGGSGGSTTIDIQDANT